MDEKLVRQAEGEMRRSAPDLPARPRKKRRGDDWGKIAVEAGRFDYKGLDDISGEVKGFIISCIFERQRSAMYEFMNFIGDYLPLFDPNTPKHTFFESDDEDEVEDPQPKGKIPNNEGKKEADLSKETQKEANTAEKKEEKEACVAGTETKQEVDESTVKEKPARKEKSLPSVKLRPVKISCQGVLFFKMEGWEKLPVEKHPRNVVKKIIDDLEAKGWLQHCQRIFPVEGMCEMKEESLKNAVGSIISDFKQQESEELIKGLDSFAVVFKGRGSQKSKGLDKKKAIELMATEMEENMLPQKLKVDLKKPKVALMVEGLPTAKFYLGCICVVDHRLLSYGSKLGMKPTGYYCNT